MLDLPRHSTKPANLAGPPDHTAKTAHDRSTSARGTRHARSVEASGRARLIDRQRDRYFIEANGQLFWHWSSPWQRCLRQARAGATAAWAESSRWLGAEAKFMQDCDDVKTHPRRAREIETLTSQRPSLPERRHVQRLQPGPETARHRHHFDRPLFTEASGSDGLLVRGRN